MTVKDFKRRYLLSKCSPPLFYLPQKEEKIEYKENLIFDYYTNPNNFEVIQEIPLIQNFRGVYVKGLYVQDSDLINNNFIFLLDSTKPTGNPVCHYIDTVFLPKKKRQQVYFIFYEGETPLWISRFINLTSTTLYSFNFIYNNYSLPISVKILDNQQEEFPIDTYEIESIRATPPPYSYTWQPSTPVINGLHSYDSFTIFDSIYCTKLTWRSLKNIQLKFFKNSLIQNNMEYKKISTITPKITYPKINELRPFTINNLYMNADKIFKLNQNLDIVGLLVNEYNDDLYSINPTSGLGYDSTNKTIIENQFGELENIAYRLFLIFNKKYILKTSTLHRFCSFYTQINDNGQRYISLFRQYIPKSCEIEVDYDFLRSFSYRVSDRWYDSNERNKIAIGPTVSVRCQFEEKKYNLVDNKLTMIEQTSYQRSDNIFFSFDGAMSDVDAHSYSWYLYSYRDDVASYDYRHTDRTKSSVIYFPPLNNRIEYCINDNNLMYDFKNFLVSSYQDYGYSIENFNEIILT